MGFQMPFSFKILKISHRTSIFGSFFIFLIIFLFHNIFGFYASFLCNSYFYFCFLVEVEFLTYLRFYKPPNKVDFIIIILEKIKTVNLSFTSVALFTH